MRNSSNSSLSLGSSQEQTNALCARLLGQNVLLGIACFLGVTVNSVLLVFSFKYGRGDLTPDKLLITNSAAADLIACLISLLLHVRASNGTTDVGKNAGDVSYMRSFFYNFYGFHSRWEDSEFYSE